MKILLFSTLFPNAAQPNHGIFVENRLRKLLAAGECEARVVAPVPYFPISGRMFGEYGRYAAAPRAEVRHDISVTHPRFVVIPKLGMTAAPDLLYRGARPEVERLRRSGFDFDLIDAHYFYPDGVAAAMLARELGKPLLITARGTDINLIPQHSRPRERILWAAEQASAVITVCAALREEAVGLGMAADKVHVLRNGVDLEMFRPSDRAAVRGRLGLAGPVVLSVGHLIERKGHHLVIEALAGLPDVTLVIAGEGPWRERLERLANGLGLASRTRFLGQVPHRELPEVYGAADALVLASSREGWANVLLEAMACGTPVVATDVWGTREAVTAPQAGRLVQSRNSRDIRRAIADLLAHPPERAATRTYAEGFSWDDTTRGQLALMRAAVTGSCHRTAG